eukprot:1689659-Amphidinium_carterae.1
MQPPLKHKGGRRVVDVALTQKGQMSCNHCMQSVLTVLHSANEITPCDFRSPVQKDGPTKGR